MFKGKCCSFIFPLTILIALLCNVSCKKSPTGPIDADVTPGRRDYIWTVDTLNIPYTYFDRVWGLSPDNLWLTGILTDTRNQIYHFDGISWTNKSIFGMSVIASIFGFSSNDMWSTGQNGRIYKGNGFAWNIDTSFIVSGSNGVFIQDIAGIDHNWFFAAGCEIYNNGAQKKSLLFRYDGINWIRQNNATTDSNTQFPRIYVTNNRLYLLGITEYQTGDTLKIYEYDGKSLKTLYSNTEESDKYGNIAIISGKPYFLFGRKVYNYENENLKLIIENNDPQFDNGINGRSSKDIFFNMLDGIMHYNGADIVYLYKNPGGRFWIRDIRVFENDIICIANDFNSGLNFIIHGKLKAKG